MAFDFKREYREFYLPPREPGIVDVPEMTYLAVRGSGDPNEEDGSYKRALDVLYSIAYTIRMSHKGDHAITGFYEYVVPPLEGFWWQKGRAGVDHTRKETFNWISMIRVPEFVTQDVFEWAKDEAERKKGIDCSLAELYDVREGTCVQAMHLGPFENEPETIDLMDEYAARQGYELDFNERRLHHEIYLSDPRRTAPEKRKTVIRHPIRRA
ncbi:MAG: GyrI-like domain-containing protein [Atopobiaceae bacterium]|jgi:hypothetical protein|nr:GyrI-like domain-containing protein [Atopobiaceae bacterium]MCI2174127.1 GyrI-like domain-containing protein [Atopobiaceae bacterium]MCI2206768.1 GyrI-like domain-containing protein [Atopobiaceae bacterium]